MMFIKILLKTLDEKSKVLIWWKTQIFVDKLKTWSLNIKSKLINWRRWTYNLFLNDLE